jgi:hypothetical protein
MFQEDTYLKKKREKRYKMSEVYYKIKTTDKEQFCGHIKNWEKSEAINNFLIQNPNYSENDVLTVDLLDD